MQRQEKEAECATALSKQIMRDLSVSVKPTSHCNPSGDKRVKAMVQQRLKTAQSSEKMKIRNETKIFKKETTYYIMNY